MNRRRQGSGTNQIVGAVRVISGAALIIALPFVLFVLVWIIAFQRNSWRYGPHSYGAAEIEAAVAEAIYQPIIDGAELEGEGSSSAARSRVHGNVPTSVYRTYSVDGLFVDAAQTYLDAAVADGWVLQEFECSTPELVSVLRFRDPTNESRGEVEIRLSPNISHQTLPRELLTVTPAIKVTIEVTTAPAGEVAVFQAPTCLDTFAEAMLANGLPRLIEGEEMLDRITAELLATSGVGEGLVVRAEYPGLRVSLADDAGVRSVLTVDDAKWSQIAARWERQPNAVFSFTDDGGDYWYVPVDGGALIIEQHTGHNGEVLVSDEAMRNLGLALRDGWALHE